MSMENMKLNFEHHLYSALTCNIIHHSTLGNETVNTKDTFTLLSLHPSL